MKYALLILLLISSKSQAQNDTSLYYMVGTGVITTIGPVMRNMDANPDSTYGGPRVAGFCVYPAVMDNNLSLIIGGKIILIETCYQLRQFKKDFPYFFVPKEALRKYNCKPNP